MNGDGRSGTHIDIVHNPSSMADAPCLPEHIAHQILFHMPTKPLFRLKCLSKHWNHVISDPDFIKSRSRRMIFLSSLPFHAVENSPTATGSLSMTKLFSPLIDPKSYTDITIVGSFNGIVLLVLQNRYPLLSYHNRYDHMILYNPLTAELKTVPNSRSYGSYNYVYGFGYCKAADDLKIVKARDGSFYGDDSIYYEVFDLKTWSWSRPSNFIGDYLICNSYEGTFTNGFLYWNAMTTKTYYRRLILALAIKTMVFSEIEIPDECNNIRLGTYNGRLCMFCENNMGRYELRVTNEDGDLWSAVYLLPLSFPRQVSRGIYCILDDGKLLSLNSSEQLVICDMFKDSHKEVDMLTSFRQVRRLQAIEYVESLISPSDICSAFI